MNPIYRFQLSAGADSRQAFPVYGGDLAIDYELEQNQEFYRGKLSGKLTFQKDDYLFIRNKAFDTQFDVVIFISYDGGQTWAVYWSGRFWKTDCQFNDDDQTAIVTPDLNDRYNAVLAGMEKEYNLIDLAPIIQPVKLDKRPMIQIYVPGQSVIGCFLAGMWWEQECEAESDETKLAETGDGKLNFYKLLEIRTVVVTNRTDIADGFFGIAENIITGYSYTTDNYRFAYTYQSVGNLVRQTWTIYRVSDNERMWEYVEESQNPTEPPMTITLQAVSGAGNVVVDISDIPVYTRYICDVDTIGSLATYKLGDSDIVQNNRNYSRVVGYGVLATISVSAKFSSTPTKWGIYQPGKYYMPPETNNEYFPVSRSTWGLYSIWFNASSFDYAFEELARASFTLRDAYPIFSVISVLLAQFAPGITHDGTSVYSEFLYGSNPITNIEQMLLISPKSNIVSSGYDQPAQTAPITLKDVTDMLRDCFRCFWFIDDQNRFRIEHISYFMRGGTYTGLPVVGIDLTQQIVTRNGKSWSFSKNQYQFDKPDMAARYQFGWMDDVTAPFEGFPIDIISGYVNQENIEQVDVSQFTSDVDFILLNPSSISRDGFVLLAAQLVDGEYSLPYISFVYNNSEHVLQNGLVAFVYLQQFYLYDLPASTIQINGVRQLARGVRKMKRQTINFPLLREPDFFNLIKTELGDGTVQKISVNLSSRNANATLMYDTE